eukprot:m.38944 g.38944  ORF g.38944 m.38944 type:complete len:274 (-) comp12625_c0_seq1:33-854(-)
MASHAQSLADLRGVSYKGQSRDWRKRFKQRCLKRLKAQRDVERASRRGLSCEPGYEHDGQDAIHMDVAAIMTQQLEQLQQQVGLEQSVDAGCSRAQPVRYMKSETTNPDLDTMEDEEDSVDILEFTLADHDELLLIWDEIQNELLLEDAALLVQRDDEETQHAERELQDAEDELEATLELHDADSVPCPVCQLRFLQRTGCVFHCGCGLRLNTQDESMTLANLHQLIKNLLLEHEDRHCPGQVEWSTSTEMLDTRTCTLLQAVCPSCAFFEVV